MRDLIKKAFDAALAVPEAKIITEVERLRAKHPDHTNEQLARRLIKTASWKGAAVGMGTGLFSNPIAAGPIGLTDASLMLRSEVLLAAHIAVIYDRDYFDQPDAVYELLLPIWGKAALSQALAEVGMQVGKSVSRRLVRKHLSKAALGGFQRFMLKHFGVKVTQKAVVTKTVPLIGGLIGGVWNHFEVRLIGGRVVDWFEGRQLATR